ncbi:putative metal homeostasis protein [Companilactobacillus versmoldensis]|nr:putative metal homeostasis protein [Companilactobacillus versmoldensis]
MSEKIDFASASRRLRSKNIKTRRRALKIIKQAKRVTITKKAQ